MNSPILKAILLAVAHTLVMVAGALVAIYFLGGIPAVALIFVRKMLFIFIPTLFVIHHINQNAEKETKENFKPLHLLILAAVGAGYVTLWLRF